MSVEEVFGLIFVKKISECLKSLRRQIKSVIELICRGMSHQDIESPMPK